MIINMPYLFTALSRFIWRAEPARLFFTSDPGCVEGVGGELPPDQLLTADSLLELLNMSHSRVGEQANRQYN